MTTYGPGGDTSRYLDPAVIGSHVLVRTLQENSDVIKQARFTLTWKEDNVKVDTGMSYVDDNFTLQSSNTFANNFWQAYGGYGAPSGRTSGVVVPSNIYRGTIGTSGFIPGFSGAGSLPPGLLVYSPYDLYGFLEGLGDPWTQQINGFNYPGDGTAAVPTLANSLANCASAIRRHCATTMAPSISRSIRAASRTSPRKPGRCSSARISTTELGGKPFHLGAGLRRRKHGHLFVGSGTSADPCCTVSPADPTLLTTTFSDSQPITTDSDYAYPAAEPRHETRADGQVAPAVRCLAHVDSSGDQLPDAGAQRGRRCRVSVR